MNLWKVKHADLRRAQAQQLAEILTDIDPADPILETKTYATAGGDEHKLRGIPVVGARGVGGAIPGSRPGARL